MAPVPPSERASAGSGQFLLLVHQILIQSAVFPCGNPSHSSTVAAERKHNRNENWNHSGQNIVTKPNMNIVRRGE
jgi:hypothetical protein